MFVFLFAEKVCIFLGAFSFTSGHIWQWRWCSYHVSTNSNKQHLVGSHLYSLSLQPYNSLRSGACQQLDPSAGMLCASAREYVTTCTSFSLMNRSHMVNGNHFCTDSTRWGLHRSAVEKRKTLSLDSLKTGLIFFLL